MALQHTRLPWELWMNILDKVESAIQLSECRLVCSKWDKLAEAAMFSKNICITKEGNIIKLCDHLAKNPSRANLIQSLEVYVPLEERPHVYTLLRLAFTPTMQNLTILAGSAMDADFFGALYGLVKGSAEEHYNLKVMPMTLDPTYENYANAALAFKDTLHYLQTSYSCSALTTRFGKLSEFKQLEVLELEAEPFQNVFKLDAILKNCRKLKTLELFHRNGDDRTEQDAATMASWTKRNVEKVSSLTQLRISYAYPDLVQYLTFKYPSIQSLNCTMPDIYQDDNFQSVMDAVKSLPEFHIQFMLENHNLLNAAINTICQKTQGAGFIIDIEYRELMREDLQAELQFATSSSLGKRTHLAVYIAENESHQLHQGILTDLQNNIGSNRIHHLNMDLLSFRRWSSRNPPEESKVFYDIVDKLPALENLHLNTDRIVYQPSVCDRVVERQLEKIIITYAVIDTRVFPQISTLYPALRMLTLESCTTVDEQQQDNNIQIDMPYTRLLRLDLACEEPYINFTGDFDDHIASMVSRSKAFGDAYVKLSLLDSDTQLHWKLNGSLEPTSLNAEEYESHYKNSNNAGITIICASLDTLIIQLGEFRVWLDL
ncbi:hypothetical protein V8B55DRAFT_1454471 [Mucor lusitanicus]|uniref:F-box domain-containing protein n=2 Tax=Mucor circinelloides f. lusitanicus TaxID=29924 RepID=A0A168K020_MUCCL|nr:hypothetical protein FB192DRAFT_1349153 [Mucor lusitanicus]OAD01825.1 hypothetical protein MUCCIDRAFT_163777 [Mucor lusitanicus CBS 277.49]